MCEMLVKAPFEPKNEEVGMIGMLRSLGFALILVAVALPADAARHLIFRNTDDGGYAYLKLNSNGTLKNTTLNQGLGLIAPSYPGTGFSFAGVLDMGSTTNIIVANSDGSRYAWMKLNSNGTLANRTVNNGVAWLHPASLNLSSWSYVGVHENADTNGSNHLLFQNTSNGALGFLRLNVNGTLENTTANEGYGRIDFALNVPPAWRAVAIQSNGDGDGNTHIVLSHTSNGRAAFLKLNSNGTMANASVNQGYGLLNQGGFGNFAPVGIQQNGDGQGNDHMLMRNPGGGVNAFAFVKLNNNGTIENLQRNQGWAPMQDRFSLNSFEFLGIGDFDSSPHLLLRSPTGGRVAWMRLNVNGTMRNRTVNQGAGWVASDYSGAGWRCEALDPNDYPD